MRNSQDNTLEETQRDKTEFAIVIAIIQQSSCQTAEKESEISEVNAMLGKICSSFLLVPSKLHSHCNYIM